MPFGLLGPVVEPPLLLFLSSPLDILESLLPRSDQLPRSSRTTWTPPLLLAVLVPLLACCLELLFGDTAGWLVGGCAPGGGDCALYAGGGEICSLAG